MSSPPTPVLQWNVYSADRHLVASYSTQPAAAGHVATWPALYYTAVPATGTTVDSATGLLIPTTSV